MANPQNLTWTGPTTYVDGTPFGAADFAGYEVEVNGASAFAVPVAWNDANTYSFPVASLPGRVQGTNTVRMRTVAANGLASDWTGAVSFTYASVPLPPTNLAIA